MLYLTHSPQKHPAWNKGKLIGQKPPLKLKEVWAIRTRLQMAHKTREQAKAEIFDYIEVFYNRARRHQHLGNISSEAYEAQMAKLG